MATKEKALKRTSKTYWMIIILIALLVIMITLIFCLTASETVQLVVAGATLLLAIAAFASIKENGRQFVISKSPVLKIDLRNFNISQYKDKDEKDWFSDNIELNIKNVGFALAFNIRIVCKRADKLYDVDLGNKLSCFDLEQGETRRISCSCSELSKEHLEKPIKIETEYIGILRNKILQSLTLPIQQEGHYVTALTDHLDFGV
jgi:hypothetical protein